MTFESVIDPRLVQRRLPRPFADGKPDGWDEEVAALEAFISYSADEFPRRPGLGKRAVDVIVGSALAIAALPVIAVLAVCVAASLRTWPFFVHRRVGRNGKLFPFPKLRTLDPSTPEYASKYEIDLEVGGIASFLRRTHLDELPQLLVVPLGWMSLVGPRPKMPHEFEPAPAWYVEARTLVPQGCTGLWQVGNHTHELPHETPDYDLFYLGNASLRLDVWILWRTVLDIFGLSRRPVVLDDVPAWAMRKRAASAVASLGISGDVAIDSATP